MEKRLLPHLNLELICHGTKAFSRGFTNTKTFEKYFHDYGHVNPYRKLNTFRTEKRSSQLKQLSPKKYGLNNTKNKKSTRRKKTQGNLTAGYKEKGGREEGEPGQWKECELNDVREKWYEVPENLHIICR